MLDIHLFRKKETRSIIKESQRNRFKDDSIVDEIYKLDKENNSVKFELNKINKDLNIVHKKIKEFYKDKSSNKDQSILDGLMKMRIDPEAEQSRLIQREVEIKKEIDRLIFGIGNILDKSVPIARNDDGNVTVRIHKGFVESDGFYEPKLGYAELMKNFTNSEAGADVVGHRGFYLQGKMALLARALKSYAIDFLVERGYEYIQTPVMMRKDVMALTSQLSDFDEQLYKVEDDLYLVATSEQPLTALYMNKKMNLSTPKMIAGDSLCFRKEAGAYGKDNAGIFRVHQFDKIEQFIVCLPEESPAHQESMINISEEFYNTLGLSYQVVLISSGKMNDAAGKKYDLEAWFPNAKKFRELVSCSNCTDYQSRNLNVVCGFHKEGEKSTYAHMLNGTLCAIQRSLCCIVENYQQDGKIVVPDVLKPYLKFDQIEI